MSGPLLYYVAPFTDETMPCAPTLVAWADWLSKPADEDTTDWRRDDIVPDGSVFDADVMERLENITATKTESGWDFSRGPESDANFFAEACAGGWDHETISDTLTGFLETQADFDTHAYVELGETVEIAVCRDQPSVKLLFQRGPPSVLTILQPDKLN